MSPAIPKRPTYRKVTLELRRLRQLIEAGDTGENLARIAHAMECAVLWTRKATDWGDLVKLAKEFAALPVKPAGKEGQS